VDFGLWNEKIVIEIIPKTKNLQVFFRLAGFVDFVFLGKKNIKLFT
jgi:hypothetical protein